MTSSLDVRTASCACGQLTIALSGTAQRVSSCSCLECQKRTGSAFGVTAFYLKEQIVEVAGEAKIFNRTADSGRDLAMRFCPYCGTTVYWELGMVPGQISVAVGCFADPLYPAPERTVFHSRKHHWMEFPARLKKYDTLPD
ncbi:MAG: GFA family protein [Pseudomonadota bacterium]